MMRAVITLMLSLTFGVAGCGTSDDDEDRVDRETVFDPLVNTLEEAKQVEDLALEQKKRMDEALEQIEGDAKAPED